MAGFPPNENDIFFDTIVYNNGFPEKVYNISKPEHLLWLFSTKLPNFQINIFTQSLKYKYIIQNNIDMKDYPITIPKEINLNNCSIEGPIDGHITISNLNITYSVNPTRPFLINNIDKDSIIKNIKFDNYNYTLFNINNGIIQDCIFMNGLINIDISTEAYYNDVLTFGGAAGVLFNNNNIIKHCSCNNININIKTNTNIKYDMIRFGGIMVINKSTIINCIINKISINFENIYTNERLFGICSGLVGVNEGNISKLFMNYININGEFASGICYYNYGTIKEIDVGKNILLNSRLLSATITIYNINPEKIDSKIGCIKLFKTTFEKYGILYNNMNEYNNIYILNDDETLNDIIKINNDSLCSSELVDSIRKSINTPEPTTIAIIPNKSKKNYGLLIGLPIGIISGLIIIIIIILIIFYKYNILSLRIK